MKSISKYLDQYAEPEAALLGILKNEGFARALVIPVFSESNDFLSRILSTWSADDQLLVIVVVNRPTLCASGILQRANRCLHEITETVPQIRAESAHISWRKASQSNVSVLLVDRCSENSIPNDQGVGLARKIGCDIALKLFAEGVLENEWVRTTDADAHLPNDYFEQELENCAARVFTHHYLAAEAPLQLATEIYDARNQQYQQSISLAGSLYGYNPTGSLLVLHLPSYAQVRGFPKRSGGEDFYLLNKLQKVGGVRAIRSTSIELECRISDRVPFGTGPAVAKLLASNHPEHELIFYHPKCFEVLKAGLFGMRSIHPEQWLETDLLPEMFQEALVQTKPGAAQKHLSPLFGLIPSKPDQQYLRHLDLWFDAFLTLKTVHYLRDNYFGCISYSDWQASDSH